MQHMHLDILLPGMLNGLAPGFMRYLLGKDDNSVRRAYTCLEIRRVVQNALQAYAALPGCLYIILL